MSIDYKAEVDSGIDRKVSIEKIVQDLLKSGMPLDEIISSKNFNIRHREMIDNLERSYDKKLSKLQDMEIEYDELGDSYHYVVHNLQELYPFTPAEEQANFINYNDLKREIEKKRSKISKAKSRKRDTVINKILAYKTKNPILDQIIAMISELDVYLTEGNMTPDKVGELFQKYGLKKEKYTLYNLMYKKYQALVEEVSELSRDIEKADQGIYYDDELDKLSEQLRILEEELIQRNIKLVNFFIREYYGSLLVEQEEIFDVCLNALANAVRNFDPSYKRKFSTFAVKAMDMAVKHDFKSLTGLNWDVYWARNKITVMLDVVSRHLGRKANIVDLCDLGLLDMTVDKARVYFEAPLIYLDSCIYNDDELSAACYSFEDYEQFDAFEDNKYSTHYMDDDEAIQPVFDNMLKDQLVPILKTLTDKERIVIVLRFGLDREANLTPDEFEFLKEYPVRELYLEEVGKILNVTRERIRQIEAKALRKLRHPSRSKIVRGYLN